MADLVIGASGVGVPPREGYRALVIDDDPSIVRFLEMYLGDEGFRVEPALSGREGLERARSQSPDVILLDYALTDPAGAEVLAELKSNPHTQAIPVVVLLPGAEVGQEVKSLGLGADDYMAKPFDIRELKTRLLSVVERRREHQQETEAERQRTLREVIASVSHEVNNPLAAILMWAEALERHHGEMPDVVKKARVIQDNVLRIRDILKRLERVKVLVSKPYVAGERILDLNGQEEDE